MLPGLEDAEYAEFDAEIDGYLEHAAGEDRRAVLGPDASTLPE